MMYISFPKMIVNHLTLCIYLYAPLKSTWKNRPWKHFVPSILVPKVKPTHLPGHKFHFSRIWSSTVPSLVRGSNRRVINAIRFRMQIKLMSSASHCMKIFILSDKVQLCDTCVEYLQQAQGICSKTIGV